MRNVATLAALLFAGPALAGPAPADALLKRAIARAGGAAALGRVEALRWSGTARIHTANGVIRIGLRTRVVPLVTARSDTWLLSEGPGRLRSLIIAPEAGFAETDGKRRALPAATVDHERAQYALYALLLLQPILAKGRVEVVPDQPRCMRAMLAPAPPSLLCFDGQGRVATLSNMVPAPEGGRMIAQTLRVHGALRSGGVRWFRRLTIDQDGRRYFELMLDSFQIERATP